MGIETKNKTKKLQNLINQKNIDVFLKKGGQIKQLDYQIITTKMQEDIENIKRYFNGTTGRKAMNIEMEPKQVVKYDTRGRKRDYSLGKKDYQQVQLNQSN